jgi:hypothetical protein
MGCVTWFPCKLEIGPRETGQFRSLLPLVSVAHERSRLATHVKGAHPSAAHPHAVFGGQGISPRAFAHSSKLSGYFSFSSVMILPILLKCQQSNLIPYHKTQALTTL